MLTTGAGNTIVIEFERNGTAHKTVRWTSDTELDSSYLPGIKQAYESAGARITSISKVEKVEIAVL